MDTKASMTNAKGMVSLNRDRKLPKVTKSNQMTVKVAPYPSAKVKQREAEASGLELREGAVRDQESAHEEESVDGDGAAEDNLPPQRRRASIMKLQFCTQRRENASNGAAFLEVCSYK